MPFFVVNRKRKKRTKVSIYSAYELYSGRAGIKYWFFVLSENKSWNFLI